MKLTMEMMQLLAWMLLFITLLQASIPFGKMVEWLIKRRKEDE